MKILQVSTSDGGGGAERSARNLADAYRAQGHESWLAVGHQRGPHDPNVFLLPNESSRNPVYRMVQEARRRHDASPRQLRGVGRLMHAAQAVSEPLRSLARARGREDFDHPGTARLLDLTPSVPDIVHLHNLHGGYFDLRQLPAISAQRPTILNVRDGWLMSGHCAFGLACERWKTGCGSCPDLGLFPAVPRDATAFNWERKRAILAGSRLHIATPSAWMMDQVRQSIIEASAVDHRVIPNGVDTRVFTPGPQGAARAALGIPADARVLLTAAFALRANPWKDYATLQEAFREIGAQEWPWPVIVLALGDEAPAQHLGSVEVRHLAFVRGDESLANHYRAADLYVHAAHVESFGNVLLEARACGAAVVATATGGIPEHVGAQDGVLVPPGDARAFAAAVSSLLRDEGRRHQLAQAGRERVAREFTLDVQARRFVAWYEELLRA